MLRAQQVTVVINSDNPGARFQIVAYENSDSAPRIIHTCSKQGDVVCWLVCNGYKWVEGSFEPQKWVKV